MVRAIAYNAAFTESAQAAAITLVVRGTYPLTVLNPGGGMVTAAPASVALFSIARALSEAEPVELLILERGALPR